MSIDIVNDGAVSTGDVYPQPGKTGVLYNAYLIKPKSELKVIPKTLMFFASAIQKAIKPLYGYEKKPVGTELKTMLFLCQYLMGKLILILLTL